MIRDWSRPYFMGFLLSINGLCWADDFVLNEIFDPLRTARFASFVPAFQSSTGKCQGDDACSTLSFTDFDKALDYSNTDRFFVEQVDRNCVKGVTVEFETRVRGRSVSREVTYVPPAFKVGKSPHALAVGSPDFIADSWWVRLISWLSNAPKFFVSSVDGKYQKVFKVLGLNHPSTSSNFNRLIGVSDLSSINVRFRNNDTGEEFLIENVRPSDNVVDFVDVLSRLGLPIQDFSVVDVYVFTRNNVGVEMLFEQVELSKLVFEGDIAKRSLSWEHDRFAGRLEERDLRFGDSRVSSVYILGANDCFESKPRLIFGRQRKVDMPAFLSSAVVSLLAQDKYVFWGEFVYRHLTDVVLVETSKVLPTGKIAFESNSLSLDCPTIDDCRLFFNKPEQLIVIHNYGGNTLSVICKGSDIDFKLTPGETNFLQEAIDCDIEGKRLEMFIGMTSLTQEINATDLILIPLVDGQSLEIPLIKESQALLPPPLMGTDRPRRPSAPVRSFSVNASDGTLSPLGDCIKGRVEGSDKMLTIDDGGTCRLSGANGGITILRLPVGMLIEASLGYNSASESDPNIRGFTSASVPNINKFVDQCVQRQAAKKKYLGVEAEKRACNEFIGPNVKVTDI